MRIFLGLLVLFFFSAVAVETEILKDSSGGYSVVSAKDIFFISASIYMLCMGLIYRSHDVNHIAAATVASIVAGVAATAATVAALAAGTALVAIAAVLAAIVISKEEFSSLIGGGLMMIASGIMFFAM